MSTSTPQIITEIVNGDALGMSAAARLISGRRGGSRACPSTIWRWMNEGSRSAEGQIVKLEAARVGGHWFTSKAALTRFIEALTPVHAEPELTGPTPTPSELRRAHEAAKKRLRRRPVTR